MGNTWGKNIRLSIFGESHGPAVGIAVDGLPHGLAVDWEAVGRQMRRRAPGRDGLSTPRRERDEWELLSGVFEGRTTGAPLCAVIRNENVHSGDYNPNLPRPGHADLAARIKYRGCADYRGGGHFSGRLTAPLVFAGALARQVLEKDRVEVGARIWRIHGVTDAQAAPEEIAAASGKAFPVCDDEAGARMRGAIQAAKSRGDSVGGVVECAALGFPAGLGDPFFRSIESELSAMMFSIPGVKGIEFGAGFGISEMTGSRANDPLYSEGGAIRFASNHSGGINGGISNGAPILFRVAFRPTPTIAMEQRTVDMARMETVSVRFGGRHDPCVVPRAVAAVEACAALCLLDFYLERGERT